MIDVEVKIFSSVHSVVAPLLAANRFVSTQVMDYAKIPAASLYELDNRTIQARLGSTPVESFSRLTYQADVVAGTKKKCREIFAALDTRMIALNFVRVSGQYITYPENPEIVRYVARYEVETDAEGNLYRPGRR